ncbi:MAG: tRNA pseudouridine(38-40) synthase TruA [Burkholderiales bacterium]|nr:tRNA pseudouridine(38-40) synthase TruA [Burkholderiales bacterium]
MGERIFRLTLEYDGSAYSGFQRLDGKNLKPSIQATLEDALARLVDHPVSVLVAGRTDAGVHATGQVLSFRTTSDRSSRVILRGANALLPPDIRVLEAVEAAAGFHPRFLACSRTYEYLILSARQGDAFWHRRAWIIPGKLDVSAMQRAGRLLLGSHDFSTYCSQVPPDECRTRVLMDCQVERWKGLLPAPLGRLDGMVLVRFRANAFLRRMVRMLTAALVEVGRGHWTEDEPRQRLDARDSGLSPPPAPPWGLYLVRVDYASWAAPERTRAGGQEP